MDSLRVNCPHCGGELIVDARTGVVLSHRRAAEPAAKDLDELFRDLEENKARAEEVFEREHRAWEDRDRLLEERFRQALARAEESPDEGPPPRPIDLD